MTAPDDGHFGLAALSETCMQVGNDRIEAMGGKRRHKEQGAQVTVADFGEAGLFAHGRAEVCSVGTRPA